MKGVLHTTVGSMLMLVLFTLPAFAADQAPHAAAAAKHKVVIQVSDDEPRKWNLALNNARNIQQELGRENVTIEIVAYGPGLPMLKLDSEVGARIDEAVTQGVAIMACENTMANTKTQRADMLPKIGYVKSGVVELMEKQRQGYAYIRP